MMLLGLKLLFVFSGVEVKCSFDVFYKTQNLLNWIYYEGYRSNDIFFGISIAQGELTNSNSSFLDDNLNRILSHWNLAEENNIYKQIVLKVVQEEGVHMGRHLLHGMLHVKSSTDTLATYLVHIDSGVPTRELSDICIAQLFSTNTCVISSECISIVINKDNTKGYHKTHQILYALLLSSQYCKSHTHYATSMRTILKKLCSSALHETRTIANLQFPSFLRDLLLEQTLFCSLAGFTEFYNQELINSLLTWQLDSGCFAPVQKNQEKHCSEHMTGLAIAYLRLLIKHIL